MEIERKYLIKMLPPELENYPSNQISQSYLMSEPTVRVRRMDEEYFLTVKGAGTLSRQEFEMKITAGQYNEQLVSAVGYPVTKRRYRIPFDGGLKTELTAELDIFSGRLDGLVTVEVEFESVADSLMFKKPEWFGEEVTSEGRYGNGRLSKMESLSDI